MASPPDNFKPFARVSLLLIGLAWTLPFLVPYHRYPMPSFYGEWLAAILGLMALVPLLERKAWSELHVPVIVLGPIGLIAVAWLQFALGMMPYPGQALAPTLYLLWAALLMVVGHLLKRELGQEAVTICLAWFLLVGGLLSAATGLLQHYQMETALGGLVTAKKYGRVFGNLAQPNHFAAYSALALASLAYLFSRDRLRSRCLVVLFSAPLLFAAALSGSRSIWLFLAVTLAMATGLFLRDRSRENRRLFLYCVALLPALALANGAAGLDWLSPSAGVVETAMDRLFTTAHGLDVRIALWREAWWMFVQSPLLGVGFGQFAWHHFEYLAAFGPRPGLGLTNHAHNIVPHLLAETGLVGFLLVTATAVLWLAGLSGMRASLELWWLLTVLAVIGAHSGLDFPLWHTFFLGIAAVATGMGATRVTGIGLARMGPAMAAILIVAGLTHAALLFRDFRQFELLVFTPYKLSSEIPPSEKFVALLPALHREPLLTPHVEILLGMIAALDEDRLEAKLEMTTRAMRYAPVVYLVYRQAMLLALAGERQAALVQLERSLRVYPGQAEEAALQIEGLARRWPDAYLPLLELAAAKGATARAGAP